MRLILDTHAFIWYIINSPQLSSTAKGLIEDENNQLFLSVASLWEMAIKYSLGKLTLALPFDVLIPQQLKINDIEILNIELNHLAVVSTLPLHHRDPFDRLIIAQSLVESIPIITADSIFAVYSVNHLW